jgi:hypothetical protein
MSDSVAGMTMSEGGGGELTGEVDQRSVSLLAVKKPVNTGVEGMRRLAFFDMC